MMEAYLEFYVQIFLNGDGNSRKEGGIPLKFGEELPHHFADCHRVASTSLDVNLLHKHNIMQKRNFT